MAPRQTLLLECSYFGRYFHGVQVQRDRRTVAGELIGQFQDALSTTPRGLTFAARTDAGVSAQQNYATCWYRGHEPSEQQLERLTQPSGSALQVTRARVVPRELNARASSRRKHYQYRIQTGVAQTLVASGSDNGVWGFAGSLSLKPMQRAARLLEGTHDFTAFRAANCDAKNVVKTIYSIQVTECSELIVVDVEGTAFLRKMVRILVGTLADVGAGLRRAESIPDLLLSKDRTQAGRAAPARGLWLMSVALLWPGMRHPDMPLMLR